jgi:hypothetical protein
LRGDLATVQEKLATCRATRKGGVDLATLLQQQRNEQELADEYNRLTQTITRIENRNREELRVREELADLQRHQHAIGVEIHRLLDGRKASQDRLEEVEKKVKILSRSKNVGELKVVEEKSLDAALAEISRLHNSIRLADEEISEWRTRSAAFSPGLQRLSAVIRGIEEKSELDRLSAVINQRVAERTALEKMVEQAYVAERNARGAHEIALGRIREREFQTNRERQFNAAGEANRRRGGVPRPLVAS